MYEKSKISIDTLSLSVSNVPIKCSLKKHRNE